MADWSSFDKKINAFEQEGYTDESSIFNSWEQTQGYINPIGMQAKMLEEQAKRDQEWEIGKSLYNGLVVQGGRGLFGTAKMLNELWAEKAAANGYADSKDDLMVGWNNVLNSSVLQRYETGNNFANHLTEGAGQLIGQIGVGAVTGGTGSMLYMGAQIAGNQYLDLTAEGVDASRAAVASLTNAAWQMPLERIGLGKILGGKLNPLKRKFVDRLRDVGEAFATEGLTEAMQELPEQLTNIWAKNAGITMREVGAEWDKNAEQNLKAAAYSGLIGGILGGAGASVRVAINSLGENKLQELHKEMQSELDTRLEANKTEGRTPEQIAMETNANLAGHEIAIEAKPLMEFMQTKNAAEVADALGVTVDQVQKAAADGLDIVVPQGNYEGTAAKYDGFRDSTREYISFDEGDYSVNAFKQKRALAQEAKLAADEQEKVDIQLHSIAQSMADAGVPMATRVGWLNVIQCYATERAANLSTKDGHKITASQWLEQNPLTWQGDGKGGGFLGFKQDFSNGTEDWNKNKEEIKAKLEKDIARYSRVIDTWAKNPLGWYEKHKNDYYDFLSQTPLIMTLVGFNQKPLKFKGEFLKHSSRGKHPGVDAYVLNQIPKALAEPLMVLKNYETDKNGNRKEFSNKRTFVLGVKARNGATMLLHAIIDYNTGDDFGVVNLVNNAYGVGGKNASYNFFYKAMSDVLLDNELNPILDKSGNTIHNDELMYLDESEARKWFKTVPAKSRSMAPLIRSRASDTSILHKSNLVNAQKNNFGMYQENNEQIKGAYSPMADGSNIIQLFKGSDTSTVIHETGHYFFEMFMRDSALDYASDQMKADREAFLKYGECTEEHWQYLHSKPRYNPNDPTNTNNLTKAEDDDLVRVHERVAEAFETYFIEGKAPSRELRSLFRRFSSWLKSIYGIIREGEWGNRNENAIELNDDVRRAFDHWLASEQEIEAVARIDGYFANMPKVFVGNLSDSTKDRLAKFAEGAREKAIEIMVKKAMVNFTAERRAAIANYRKSIRGDVEQEIRDNVPVYAAMEMLKENELFKRTNLRTFAAKYLIPSVQDWTDWRAAKAANDKFIKAAVDDTVASLRSDLKGYNKRTVWDNNETGEQDVDVSDLIAKNATELTSGRVYTSRTDYGDVPAWVTKFVDENGHKPTREDLKQIARDLYIGNDYYGVNAEQSVFNALSAEEAADVEATMKARQEELDNAYKTREMLADEKTAAELFEKMYDLKSTRGYALSPEMRTEFEQIAEIYFDSGNALAQAIVESPTFNQAVNERIQQYVDERFPDIYKERAAAEQAAREAMYNDKSEELLALESQLVYEQAQKAANRQFAAEGRAARVANLKAQAALAAKAEIARMALGDASNTKTFVRAERRAAANAAKALKAGDYETAYAYKQQQMLNHAMARESIKIRQEMTKSVKFLRALRKWKREKWGNEQHLGQAGFLMARMGIKAKGYTPEMHTEPLAQYVEEMRAAYGDDIVDVAPWLLNETVDLSNPRAMTISQYRDCINALKNLRQISMQDQVMHAFAKNMAVQEWKDEATVSLNKLEDKYKPDPNGKQKPSWWEQYKASMRSTDNFFEMMDGWTNGFFSKTMMSPLKHCADLERKMILAMEKRTTDAYTKWLVDKAARNAAEEKIHYDELGCSVDRHTLVRLLANMGNDGNARVLCTTPPLGMENGTIWVKPNENITAEEAVELTKANMIKFLGSVLTKADIEYAQSLIDNANYYWNELAQVERNTKGFAPVKVEAVPVLLQLGDGSAVLFKGGYFPLVQNREGGYRPNGQDALNIDTENQSPPSAMFSTNQGSSKKRVNAKYPIDMSRGAEFRSMRDTIHDIAYRELMADFRNIFNDPEMYRLMLNKLGLANMRQLKEFLTVAANPYGNGTNALGESTFSATANWLRRKTVNAAIMLNLKTAFQNLGNITLYGNSVEGFTHQDAYNAVMKYGLQAAGRTESDTDRLIAEKSVFMTERALAPDITWKEAIETMPAQWEQNLGLDKVEKGALKWGARLLAYTDNLTAKPVWRYAYEKKIAAGASEQEAVDFADSVIRRTLGSNRAQDVSSMQRGSSLFRIFTTFQGFFNTQYSQWEREYNIAAKLVSEGQRKEAMKRIVLFAASKWLLNCLICVFLGMENPFKKDKETDILNKWGQECLSYPMSMAGPWGQGANMITNSLIGVRSYSYRMAAIQSTVDRYNKLARTTNNYFEGKATGKDLFENISSVALPLIGAPDQIHKLFWNGFDYFYGNMSELEASDLVRRRPKSERK